MIKSIYLRPIQWIGFYGCHYGVKEYGHKVWAKNEIEAQQIAKSLNFIYDGISQFEPTEYRPSVLAQLPGGLGRYDVIHALCFLSFLAHRAGIESEDVCGDESALHALIHYRAFGRQDPSKFKKIIAEKIVFLEKNIPGIPPKRVKLMVSSPTDHKGDRPSNLKEPFIVEDWV